MSTSKPQFVFYFVDEPQFATQDSRESTANLLRSYRAHPERFLLKRLGSHRYSIQTHGYTATAMLEHAPTFYRNQLRARTVDRLIAKTRDYRAQFGVAEAK